MVKTKVLGIIALCIGWLIPIAGVILAIVGLSLKKDPKQKEEEATAKTLNIIALIESIVFWIIWIGVYGRTI